MYLLPPAAVVYMLCHVCVSTAPVTDWTESLIESGWCAFMTMRMGAGRQLTFCCAFIWNATGRRDAVRWVHACPVRAAQLHGVPTQWRPLLREEQAQVIVCAGGPVAGGCAGHCRWAS